MKPLQGIFLAHSMSVQASWLIFSGALTGCGLFKPTGQKHANDIHFKANCMHEVSIAMSILNIVEEEVAKENGHKVQELVVDVGALSGVVLDSLDFAMQGVKQDTLLQDADIQLNPIEGLAKCLDCECEFPADNVYALCPDCDDFNITIVQGKELQIKKITFD